MRKAIFYLIMTLNLFSCIDNRKVLISEGIENWGDDNTAGDKIIPRHKYKSFTQGKDTLTYISNYYPNGNLKSRVIMKNDQLWEIEIVLDTIGNKKKFGKFKKGNGYVIQFTNDTGIPEYKGKYINGNKEGWWKHYHFKGSIMDSTLYKEGYDVSTEQGNSALEELIGSPGFYRNNLYE